MGNISEIDVKLLTQEEKFRILQSEEVDSRILEYLYNKLGNLYIEILEKAEGSIFELMKDRKLKGWCWQTTESAIVFFNDNDYIERGNLYIDNKLPKLFHSWICFQYNGTEYVFDPSNNLLCKKENYFKIFAVEVMSKVFSWEVKEELIRQITILKNKYNQKNEMIWKYVLGKYYEEYHEKHKDEVVLQGSSNVNNPLYENTAGYRSEIENGRIKKLTVHYYYIGG